MSIKFKLLIIGLDLFLIALLVVFGNTGFARARSLDDCKAKINSGHWSTADSDFCHRAYDLPSPYLIKCLNNIENDFENYAEKVRSRERMACHCTFRDDVDLNWGDQKDYDFQVDLPEKLRPLYFALKHSYLDPTKFDEETRSEWKCNGQKKATRLFD